MVSQQGRLALFVLLIAIAFTTAQAQPYRPAPLFTGQSLPEPPHQHDPWMPPNSNLPEKCVSSIQSLVSYGFANPRGCEYREVEMDCQNFVMKTHAWVIPTTNRDEKQRFAVAWSGLVYPLSAVSDPADLQADIAALINHPAGNYRSSAPMESDLAAYQTLHELKICMLLFVGEQEAAEQLWKTLQGEAADTTADPYLGFAHEYAWANYNRAVSAHERADDVISLLSAEATSRLRDNIEKDAAARGLKRPSQSQQGKPNLYLDFLANIDVLIADEQRRVKAEKVERVLKVGSDKFPDQKQRIAALIRDLEEVSARQMSQPGGVYPGQDPIVQALVKEGEAAIDPLIRCFEVDTRLTRSVGFHRSFFPYRYFIGVDDAAYTAISEILKVRSFGPLTEHPYHSDWHAPKRGEIAKEIRAYWNKVRGVAELDRWYQTLADDNATAQQLLETVKKIVAPTPRPPGALVPPRMVTALGPPSPLAGEGLRDRKDPSITELLRKRADEVAAQNPNTSQRVYSQQYACEITLALAKWELKAAAPEVRKRIEQCKVLFADSFHASHARLLAPWFSQVCAAGIEAGDEMATDEYAKWLVKLSPDRFEYGESTGPFYALCRFPDHQKLSAAARVLFLNDSPYYPLHAKPYQDLRLSDYVSWPLIGVPEFCQMVIRELRNKNPSAFELTLDQEKGYYSIKGGGQIVKNTGDGSWPEAKNQRLRVCDVYASALTSLESLEGVPWYEPYWPEDRRDAAVAEIIAFLERWGHCFCLLPSVSFNQFRHPFHNGQFHLPKLDSPATSNDVEHARAIFTLRDGKSEVRQVTLPMFPQMARWKTLDKFPIRYPGHTGPPTEYDRSGFIWQAEEVLVDGKWQRFYGFVGNHIIAKVPADEIEVLEKRDDDRFLRW